MSSAFYCPGELAEPRRRSRGRGKGAKNLDPDFLLEAFDGDGYCALAAAVLVSLMTGRKGDGRFGPKERGFLRSRWFRSICAGLDLDPDVWKVTLQQAAREAKGSGESVNDAAIEHRIQDRGGADRGSRTTNWSQ